MLFRSMAMMDVFGIRLGFGFSAGLFDYVLNYSRSTQPLMLLPIGAVYFGLYYGLFRFFILRFDLKTPGREQEEVVAQSVQAAADESPAHAWVRALGGAGNLVSVDACTTRLRLVVADQKAIDEAALKQLGARGVVRPSQDTLQVVVGPIADQVAGEIRAALSDRTVVRSRDHASTEKVRADVDIPSAKPASVPDARALAAALGGIANIATLAVRSSRLSLTLKNSTTVNEDAMRAAGVRSVVHVGDSTWHVIVGPAAEATAKALQAL